jgi:Na+-transporting methylmalonyl-CoA/oxaloacetate decarboxylase gamma subunit
MLLYRLLGGAMLENTFANVMRISMTGFGLVIVVMVVLAAIMEVMGHVVQKWERKRRAGLKEKES